MKLIKSLFVGAISLATFTQAALSNIIDESAEQTYANTLTVAKTGPLIKWVADDKNKANKMVAKLKLDKTAYIAV